MLTFSQKLKTLINQLKTKKVLLVSVVLIALLSVVSVIDYTATQIKISKIPVDLRIKSDKEDIIGAQTILNGKIYDKEDSTKVVYEGEVVKYAYKTEKIIDKPNEVVSKRTKNSRTIKIAEDEEKITYQLEVISGVPQYYEDEKGEWYQADYGTTDVNTYAIQTKGSVLAQLLFPNKVYATEGTFYPDADPETSTMDGWVATNDGVVILAEDAYNPFYVYNRFTSPSYRLGRGFVLFSTPIGSSAVISNVVYSVKIYSKNGNIDGYADLSVYSSSPFSNTTLIDTDFDSVGSISYGNATYDSMVVGSYSDITLNSNGIANINKTGISKFGLKVNESTPTGANWIGIYSAEETGITSDPKLVITYTVPAGNFFQMF